MDVGELVGRGRTSDVYAYGAASVLKVPHDDVPLDWPEFEAKLAAAVHSCGVSTPKVHDVITFRDRQAVVFERIDGPSMWQEMCASPADAPTLVRELVRIQESILSVGIPTGIPDLIDRLSRKIALASSLTTNERAEAATLAQGLPRGAALLHGDLHPGNVLMSESGPVIIDWFDATIGHPVADIIRSSMLMRPSETAPATHLPGATVALLRQVHADYLRAFASRLSDDASLGLWQGVLAAGRLAEHAEVDEGRLVELWQERDHPWDINSMLMPQ